jgi:hypothetical protein
VPPMTTEAVTFRTVANPPQEQGNLYECRRCGALVANPDLHRAGAHAAALEADPRRVAGRQ